MALPPSNPETFMQEVDDAVRADRLQGFARNYGRVIIAVVVIGFLAFAGWLWWQNDQATKAGVTGRNFSMALDTMGQGRPKTASQQMQPIVNEGNATYRALALMVQGNAALAENDVRGAVAKFGLVANDADVDQPLRDAALLRQTLIEFDLLQPDAVIARLRNLVSRPGPSFASAAELTALAELKRGNDRAAGQLYKRITETEGVPESLKSRAIQMVTLLGADVVRPAGATPAAATPAAAPATTPAAAAAPTKTGE